MLAFGVLGSRRRPGLVHQQTNTDSVSQEQQTMTMINAQDPMLCLRDSFGIVNWKQNANFAGDGVWVSLQIYAVAGSNLVAQPNFGYSVCRA